MNKSINNLINNILRATLISIIINILLSSSLHAYSPNIQIDRITTDQGLSSRNVTAVLHDSRGYIWIGTTNGLNLYDGYDFTVFKHEPDDTTSISSNIIMTIYEDRTGILWIGTENGGLNSFDIRDNVFKHYIPNPDNPNSISNQNVEAILEDRSGLLWVGTNSGLNVFDRKNEIFTHYCHESGNSASLSSNHIGSLYEDDDGILWIGTLQGLNSFNRDTGIFKRYEYKKNDIDLSGNNFVGTITEDENGRLWFTNWGNGLHVIDKNSGEYRIFTSNPNESSSLASNYTGHLTFDDLGYLWVGTDKGLELFDIENNNFIHFRHDPQNPSSISDDGIWAVHKGKDGVIWVGTLGGGLNKIINHGTVFSLYKEDPTLDNSLSDNEVQIIYEDSNRIIWIGTKYGLNRFDPEKNEFQVFLHNSENSLSSNDITSICEDRYGVLWIGTKDAGLNKFHRENNTVEVYKYDLNNDDSISSNMITTIHEDRRGELWIGTDFGLNKYNRNTDSFKRYFSDDKVPRIARNNENNTVIEGNKKISDNFIQDIITSRDNYLWICTGYGLSCFDTTNNNITNYYHMPQDSCSLSVNSTITIFEDRLGFLWIGTVNGLNKFDRERNNFTLFNYNNGLESDKILGINEDEKGNIWVTTDNGVSCFDNKAEKFMNYDKYDGVPFNLNNKNAFLKTYNGEFYVGGYEGFYRFYPDKINANTYIPSTVIRSIKVMNQDIISETYSHSNEIEISYKYNHVSFEFAVLDYLFPHKRNYSYMLEGLDTSWIYSGDNKDVNYSNLKPGKYCFKVRGKTGNTKWSETSVVIKIIPPFWSTLWFRFSIVGLLLFIIFISIKNCKMMIEQKSIKESEKKYRLLIDNQKELIFKLNKNREIIYTNPYFKRTIYSNDSDSHFSFIVDNDLPVFNDAINRLLNGIIVDNIETKIKTKNGKRWVTWSGKIDKLQNIKTDVRGSTGRKEIAY